MSKEQKCNNFTHFPSVGDRRSYFELSRSRSLKQANTPTALPVKVILWAFLIIFAFGMVSDPITTLLKLTAIIAGLSVFISLFHICACLTPKKKLWQFPIADNESHEFPIYTVLVPLFQEANMVESLMESLSEIDYPTDKLEIFLICESVDPLTTQTVAKKLRSPFHLIVVPEGFPQTKPRALNYSLQFAKGEFITIYDAEDRPHPHQLKTALKAFRDHPNWSALQAPLDYFNIQDSLITRQFALEYAALFHVRVPFLSHLDAPFPLGGTSNHMRRNALEVCGGWDAYNVTEDADLSFRLAALGQKIGYIDCPTQEEAVSTYPAWVKQRSRWIKGFLQTWLVHMSHPLRPLNWHGIKRFLILQITIGYTLLSSFLFAPALIATALYSLAIMAFDWPNYISGLYILAFLLSVSSGIISGIIGAIRRKELALIPWAFAMPFYWVMLFPPTIKAILELRSQPFHWHKTTHGVSRFRAKGSTHL